MRLPVDCASNTLTHTHRPPSLPPQIPPSSSPHQIIYANKLMRALPLLALSKFALLPFRGAIISYILLPANCSWAAAGRVHPPLPSSTTLGPRCLAPRCHSALICASVPPQNAGLLDENKLDLHNCHCLCHPRRRQGAYAMTGPSGGDTLLRPTVV